MMPANLFEKRLLHLNKNQVQFYAKNQAKKNQKVLRGLFS
jgi:hypothetical protein